MISRQPSNESKAHPSAWTFGVALIAVWYIYHGYHFVLRAVWAVRALGVSKAPSTAASTRTRCDGPSSVTVYLGVRNEELVIEDRLANILDTDYPVERLGILVVADGCTDGTADAVRAFAAKHDVAVELVEYPDASGKWRTQNLAAEVSSGDILISTDAATKFDRQTIPRLLGPFRYLDVTVVAGQVEYLSEGSAIGDHYRRYRRMESQLRQLESNLGILTKCDAPCVAYRRDRWVDIESFEDVDQAICLIARAQGCRSVHEMGARAFDQANTSARQDIRQRARMTRKTLQTMSHRWPLRRWPSDPIFTWAFLSHKIMRFLSPAYCTLVVVAGLQLLVRACGVRRTTALGASALLTVLTVSKLRRAALAFGSAQVGFALGVAQWLFRPKLPSHWTPTRQIP